MASPIGDTINLLSTTTPLTAGSTWTSSPVVLGQYNSLVIMIRTDADGELFVDWSGNNGVNFDATDSYNIVDNLTKRIVITTQQKVIRLRLTNGVVNQTELRLFTYGVVTNNSSLVSLVSDINIENLKHGLKGGQTIVTEMTPIMEYVFKYGQTSVTCQSNTLNCCYPDIWTGGNNANATCGITSEEFLFLNAGGTIASRAIIQGRGSYIRASSTSYTRFVASFSVSDALIGSLFVCNAPTSTNIPYSTPAAIIQMIGGFGWYGNNGGKTSANFSVIFYDPSSGIVSVPTTSWLDKCDGNSTMPLINFTDLTKPNCFQIEYSAGCNLIFSILNPATNRFVPVYQKNYINALPQRSTGEQCMTLFSFQGDTPTSPTDIINLRDFTICTDMPPQFPTSMTGVIEFNVGVAGATTNFGAIQQAISLTPGGVSFLPFNWYDLSISTSGTNPVTFKIFLDSTVTGGSWVKDALYPIEKNTTATITPSSKLLYQYELAPTDSFYVKFDPLTPLLYGFRPLSLQLTSKSTSDVYVKIGYCI